MRTDEVKKASSSSGTPARVASTKPPPKPDFLVQDSLEQERARRAAIQRQQDRIGFWPRVRGGLGFGVWRRKFHATDPLSSVDPKTSAGYGHPVYETTTAALRLDAEARPAAFFLEGIPTWLYLRLQFQTALGLKSSSMIKDPDTGVAVLSTFGTTLYEVLFDLGVDFPLGAVPAAWPLSFPGPHLRLGIGGGASSFSMNWEGAAERTQPDLHYAFFLIRLGVSWPFSRFVGAHLGFDGRVVTGAGEIQDQAWYGDGSAGGLALNLGLDGTYKGVVASVEYAYTRYTVAFDDAAARAQGNLRAAGGTLDLYHAFFLNAGYSF